MTGLADDLHHANSIRQQIYQSWPLAKLQEAVRYLALMRVHTSAVGAAICREVERVCMRGLMSEFTGLQGFLRSSGGMMGWATCRKHMKALSLKPAV